LALPKQVPIVLAQRRPAQWEQQQRSPSQQTSPTPGGPLPVGQRALGEQPSLRESLQAALVSLPKAEARPLAWPLQAALPAEPEPLPLPSFA
jgi:hypothetical protein